MGEIGSGKAGENAFRDFLKPFTQIPVNWITAALHRTATV
jgi:hypothetical protein